MEELGIELKVLNFQYVNVVLNADQETLINMARKRRKQTRKVDLRKAYTMAGYSGDYAWFIRTKVVPIIGESALHPLPSKSESRVKEYSVTDRNFHRVIKALGVSDDRYKQVQNIKKAISTAGTAATAELIVDLVEKTVQPEPSEEYPITFRIPLHPHSHNMMYKAVRSKMVKDEMYRKWRRKFFPLIQEIVDKKDFVSKVNPHKPMKMNFRHGHRKYSDSGGMFDRQNFTKAVQDCIFEHVGGNDCNVLESDMRGEFVDEYSDGYIEIQVRNI